MLLYDKGLSEALRGCCCCCCGYDRDRDKHDYELNTHPPPLNQELRKHCLRCLQPSRCQATRTKKGR